MTLVPSKMIDGGKPVIHVVPCLLGHLLSLFQHFEIIQNELVRVLNVNIESQLLQNMLLRPHQLVLPGVELLEIHKIIKRMRRELPLSQEVLKLAEKSFVPRNSIPLALVPARPQSVPGRQTH